MKIKKIITKSFQKFIIIFIRASMASKSYNVNVHSSVTKIAMTEPVIIVANHQKAMDPFVLVSFAPKTIRDNLLPIKFLVANSFYYTWRRPFMYFMGCIPAHPHNNNENYGIQGGTQALKQKYSFLIFPEGKRTPTQLPAKNGVMAISASVESVNLLLCKINWLKDHKVVDLTYKLVTNKEKSSYKSADSIMNAIYEL